MPELVQILTMVITGALQTIRNVWPDVLATSSTCCGSFSTGDCPERPKVHRRHQDDTENLINTITECALMVEAMLTLLQAMLDGITERVPSRPSPGAAYWP